MKPTVKKAIAIMAVTVMTMSATITLANETVVEPINAVIEAAPIVPFFGSYTGIVKEVTERENGSLFVELESETGGPSNFVITQDTYRVNDLEIEKGQTLIGFFENNRPMILIYPPQYNLSVVAEADDKLFVKADKFNKDLVNMDNTLKLNISENTEIVWENGTRINWLKAPSMEELTVVLEDRRLVVFYDITTRSIPAQTTPKKVIVLSKKEAEPVSDVAGFDIEVNGAGIHAANAFRGENDAVLVPVRAIAEAFGVEVSWDAQIQAVTVGENASFIIGSKTYRAYESDMELDAAPVLKDGFSYVPVEFFQRALALRTANVYEGRIVFEEYK
ncbi:MAG: stalk domain-containing protein [Clostridia bacterium]|jgi:hypothetical protein|nr:stalk domain-containing protein [Clostridia bacterium]